MPGTILQQMLTTHNCPLHGKKVIAHRLKAFRVLHIWSDIIGNNYNFSKQTG